MTKISSNSYTHRSRKNFTILQNDLIRDPSLSCRGFKLLCIGLSHDGKWNFRKDQIVTCFKEGMHTLDGAMKDLRSLGYLHTVARIGKKGRKDGHDWYWLEDPITEEEFKKRHRKGDFPGGGNIRQAVDQPDIRRQTNKKTNKSSSSRVSPDISSPQSPSSPEVEIIRTRLAKLQPKLQLSPITLEGIPNTYRLHEFLLAIDEFNANASKKMPKSPGHAFCAALFKARKFLISKRNCGEEELFLKSFGYIKVVDGNCEYWAKS